MIGPNIFVYSAYCQGNVFDTSVNGEENGSNCPIVTTIAILKVNEKTPTSQLQSRIICKLWYDDVRQPKEGISSVSSLGTASPSRRQQNEENEFLPYLINCENRFPSLIPYGISFQDESETINQKPFNNSLKTGAYKNTNRDNGFIHVHPSRQATSSVWYEKPNAKINGLPAVETTPTHILKRRKGVVACLGPSTSSQSSTSPQSLTEQVLLQNYFGVNNFIIYNSRAVSSKFLSTIGQKQFENANPTSRILRPTESEANLGLTILPWNIPAIFGRRVVDSQVEFELAQADCYFRTISRHSSEAFESSVFLEPDQILVPRRSTDKVLIKTVPKLLQHVAAEALSKGNKVSKKLMLSVRKFCAEYPSDGDNKSNTIHAINALTKSSYNSELSSSHQKVSLTYYPLGVEQSNTEVEIETQGALIHDYSPCGENTYDSDNDSETADKTLSERGDEIDKSIGKYFQSRVLTKMVQEKMFLKHNIKSKL